MDKNKQISKKKSKNVSPKKENQTKQTQPKQKKFHSQVKSVPKSKQKQEDHKKNNNNLQNEEIKNDLLNNENQSENDNNMNNKVETKKKINTRKSAPFSIVFGNKKIPPGNINPDNINNPNQDLIKKKQSNKFSHQSPLRYNRPFQNNDFNLNSKYKNKSNIYSVFIKNYLDSSHLYDLHKANWDVTQPNIPTAKLRKIKLGNPFAVGNT